MGKVGRSFRPRLKSGVVRVALNLISTLNVGDVIATLGSAGLLDRESN